MADTKLVISDFREKIIIPRDWELSKMEDLSIKIKAGGTPPTEKISYYQGDIPFVTISDMSREFKYLASTSKNISEDGLENSAAWRIPANSLLLSMYATIGKPLITKKEVASHQGILGIIPDPNKMDLEFLFYSLEFLKNKLTRYFLIGTQANLNLEIVKNLKIIHPINIKEQEKISKILINIDSIFIRTKKIILHYQNIKDELMQQLFSRGIKHTEFKKVKSKYEKDLEIPASWDYVLLDKVSKRGSGHTPNAKISEYYNGGIKWISLADSDKLDNVYISKTEKEISQKGIENSSAVLHPAGIVVLSRDAGVGKSAITTTEMAVSQHFMVWECGDELNNHFLYYLLQYQKPYFEAIATGTTIKTIGLSFFKKFKIILPPRREQEKISCILFNIDKAIWANQEYLKRVITIRKGVMQKLLTGQIRVKI